MSSVSGFRIQIGPSDLNCKNAPTDRLLNKALPSLVLMLICASPSYASPKIKCQKEAEAVAIAQSKKKGNLSPDLLSPANPTEMDGGDIVVYIGAHAYYNYFKLKMDRKCRLVKIVDVEYAE